jgi:hypothetical protein
VRQLAAAGHEGVVGGGAELAAGGAVAPVDAVQAGRVGARVDPRAEGEGVAAAFGNAGGAADGDGRRDVVHRDGLGAEGEEALLVGGGHLDDVARGAIGVGVLDDTAAGGEGLGGDELVVAGAGFVAPDDAVAADGVRARVDQVGDGQAGHCLHPRWRRR